jgi:hypothetical protein
MGWCVAKSLLRLREQINQMAPNRNKKSDGTVGDAAHASRNSDHNPWVKDGNMGVVTALDITNDIANGCDAQKIVDALVSSRDPRIKYIIWNQKIVDSNKQPWVWLKYTGQNPHTHHFHISVKSDKTFYNSIDSWRIQENRYRTINFKHLA